MNYKEEIILQNIEDGYFRLNEYTICEHIKCSECKFSKEGNCSILSLISVYNDYILEKFSDRYKK